MWIPATFAAELFLVLALLQCQVLFTAHLFGYRTGAVPKGWDWAGLGEAAFGGRAAEQGFTSNMRTR